jgi:hypothetical protein
MRKHFTVAVSVVGLAVLAGCSADAGSQEPIARAEERVTTPTSAFPSSYARQWMTNFQNSVKGDGLSPAIAARTYTYAAVAIYESLVNGMPGYRSLGGQLNGLDPLPEPDSGKTYDWPTVLASTMDTLVNGGMYLYPHRVFFAFTTGAQASLRALGPTQIGYRRAAGVPDGVIADSMAFGGALGGALLGWIHSDGFEAVQYKGWIAPEGPDKWVSTGFSDTDKVTNPTDPYFGTVRPAVLMTGDECAPPGPPAFSQDPTSSFFSAANDVHNESLNQPIEHRTIARFWADPPVDTSTPSGHWVGVTNKFIRPMTLADAAAAYARVGLGFMDSFIAIWDSKYRYNLIRPETYIRRNIDNGWIPLIPTPQFPAYVSGHAGESAAAASLLTATFGNGAWVDDTKVRRGFAPRNFANFEAAAEEAAVSRFYGGIHYNFDDNDGLDVGHCVASKILGRVHFM